jgi:hypothetical protein
MDGVIARLEEPEESVDGVLLVDTNVVQRAGWQMYIAGVRFDARGGFTNTGLDQLAFSIS